MQAFSLYPPVGHPDSAKKRQNRADVFLPFWKQDNFLGKSVQYRFEFAQIYFTMPKPCAGVTMGRGVFFFFPTSFIRNLPV